MIDGVRATSPATDDRSVYYIIGVTVMAECSFLALSFFWL